MYELHFGRQIAKLLKCKHDRRIKSLYFATLLSSITHVTIICETKRRKKYRSNNHRYFLIIFNIKNLQISSVILLILMFTI